MPHLGASVDLKTHSTFPTSMPEVVVADRAAYQAESLKWSRKAASLYRQYILAMAATVLTVAAVVVLWALPLIAPLFGDMYLFGSPSV